MHRERWNKIEAILDTALTLSDSERTKYIEQACRQDNVLLKEVYEILQGIEKSNSTHFLEGVTEENEDLLKDLSNLSYVSQENMIGKRIGVFRVTGLLGTGGMGDVYKAERADGQFSQVVAIKILQKGIQSEETLRRFRMEQEILASLKHPNIAQLYDGGVTEDGTPYLVMEYVEGDSIDSYCEKYQLSVDERIGLFKNVCKAVQFAHTNLIIHRDLKAQNILVTAEGMPKILDFGIAKLLDPKLSQKNLLQTQPGQKFWTPQYAAPEQIQGRNITVSVDIYALGVLLHKLLTGLYPLNLKNKNLIEVEKAIIETDPQKPSKLIAENQNINLHQSFSYQNASLHVKKIKGDLDAVILKSLRKDPLGRYQTVEQLADDLDRFIEGFPVKARPETLSYRTKKYLRRNKLLVGSAIFLLMVTSSASVISTNFALDAQEAQSLAKAEASEAKRQTAIANSVNTFLQSIITQADPMTNPKGSELTLVEAVELAAGMVEDSFSEQPDVESAVRFALGSVDMNLGRLDDAIMQFEKSLNLATEFHGQDHRQTFYSRAHLGLALIKAGKLDSAKMILEDDLSVVRLTSKENWDAAAQIDNQLGLLYLNKGDGGSAEPHLRVAAERKAAIYGEEHPERLTTLHNLSGALWMQGNHDEALSIATEILDIRRDLYEGYHPKLAQSLNVVSYFYMQSGQYEKALPLKREDLELRKALYDEDHPDLARGMHNLAHLLILMEESEEAQILEEKALAMWQRILPPEHPDVQRGHVVLSKIYRATGSFNKAETLIKNYLSDLGKNDILHAKELQNEVLLAQKSVVDITETGNNK